MSGAKETSIYCQDAMENENFLADSASLDASLFAPLNIPNFKQANASVVQRDTQQLRINELEIQVIRIMFKLRSFAYMNYLKSTIFP
ncbi:unnamed protein product [Meloidogyne enterolobii]|uniref:Uncharacterized protein n=1 Tax=Meloidogyne enterolobii TaxID=390850 RepID=A0ACB0XS91_MELEN